jgi:hypothetical protein
MIDWHQIADNLPHLSSLFMVTKTNGNMPRGRVNTTRVLESLIIAGVTGAITMYGIQIKLDAQMAEIRAQMVEMKLRANEDRMEALRRDVRIEDRVESLYSSTNGNGRPH